MQDLIAPQVKLEWLVEMQARLPNLFTDDDMFKALAEICINEMGEASEANRVSVLKHISPGISPTAPAQSMRAFLALYGMRLLVNGNGTYGMSADGSLLADRAKLLDDLIALIGTHDIPIDHLSSSDVSAWIFRNADRIRLHAHHFSDSPIMCVANVLGAYGYGLQLAGGFYLANGSSYDVAPRTVYRIADEADMVIAL